MSSGRITRANQQSIQRGQQRRGVGKDETGVGREDEKIGRSTRSNKEAAEDVNKEKEKETGRVTRARTVLSTSVINGVGLRARRRSTAPVKEEKPVVKEEKATTTESPIQKRILEVVIPASPIMPVNATASSSSPTPKGMSLRRGRTGSISTASVTSSVADNGPVKTRTSTRMKRQKEESVSKAIEGSGGGIEADKGKKVVETPKTRRRSRSATSSGLSSPAEETFVTIKPEMERSIEMESKLDVVHDSRPSPPARQSPVDASLAVVGALGVQVKPADASTPPIVNASCGIIPTSMDNSSSEIPSISVPPSPLPTASISARSTRPTAERPQTAAGERPSRRSVKRSSSPTKPVETSSAVHSLRSTKGQSRRVCDVPFPPIDLLDPDHGGLAISPEEKENGSLVADDLKDEKLLAVCAALDLFGNRALTATEIGDACVSQGWMRPSPALPSSSLVQSAIRAYQRRCATHHPERICLIRKHILAGYAMESRLIPALHPSAAQDGCRRKGMVFYLEGQVGHRVWSNPFDMLQDEDGTSDSMQIDKPAQETRCRKHSGIAKGKQTKGKLQPQPASTSADDVEMEVERPPLQDKPSGLKIKIKLGGVYNGTMEPALYTPLADDFAMVVERDMTDDDSDDQGSSSEDYSEEESVFAGREDSYAFPEYGEDESEDSDDADDADGLPRNTSIKDLARSFFMDSPPEAIVTEPLPNHVRFSPLPSPAMSMFPANPLDSGIFDDTDYMPALSPPDEQAGSSSDDEDEAATEFMDTLDYGRLNRNNISTKRVNFHPMAYRDAFSPTDLDGSEIDTPATTPRTYCDDEDEPDVPKCEPADGAMDADAADVDDDLQKAVQVLGQLLPDFSDPSESIHGSHNSGFEATNTVETMEILANKQDVVDNPAQGATSSGIATRRRKTSIGARDFLRLSLPFPLCPAPSPLQSPAVPNQSGLDADFTRYHSLDQMDDATAIRTTDSDKEKHAASVMELLPDLDQQLALADCELACVCNPEPLTLASMRVDSLSPAAKTDESGPIEDNSGNHEHDLMEGMEDPQSWADLLGPESVGLEELDNVWGFMNAAVAAVASGQSIRRRKGEADSRSIASTRSDSSDKTLQQKDIWGAIGVGGVDPSRRMEQARFRKALLSKAKALVGAKLSTSPSSPRKTQRAEQSVVEEEEAIGLEDVADAFISAWADGDTILEEDSLDIQSPNATAVNMDEEMTFTAGLYAESSADSIGVSPSVLTNSVALGAVAVAIQDGPSKSDFSAKPLHKAAKHVQTALEPCPVILQAAPVTCTSATHPPVDLPLQAGGGSSASGDSASNLVTVPGISTRFPIKLPAPPRPNAHTKPQAITESNPAKSGPQHNPVATSSDLVSLTSVPWKGPSSCRRIVPDYVNFSAVLRAVKHPDIAEVEEKVQRISTSVTLRDGPPLANGIWLPMDVAETEAERVNIVPNDLRDLSLRAGLRCQSQSSSMRDQNVAASEIAGTPPRLLRGSDRIPEPLSDTPRSRSRSPSPRKSNSLQAASQHKLSTITPSKRLNPSIPIKSGEPATKRRKSSITSAPLDSARPLTRAQKHNSRKSPA